jgi:hypothetical protein
MTELRKDKHFFVNHSNGIIGTNLSTFATIIAFLFIYPGDRNRHRVALGNIGMDENIGIWLLYITVQ